MPRPIDEQNSKDAQLDADVIAADCSSNGLLLGAFAAKAASARSKIVEAIRLLDDGDVDGARDALGAAALALES